jgi:predicted site-specific integrase-resolvase
MEAGLMGGDLTIKDAAKRLDVSSKTVSRMIQRGQLPNAYKRNPFATRRAEWFIPESDVEAVEKLVNRFKSATNT